VAEHRRHWRVWQRYMDPGCFVFLDETSAATNMISRYGWGPRSERLIDAAPHGHWRTTTFIAGLRSTGLVAPLVLDGPMTGEAFLAYVGKFLAPTLAKGDVVVLDNPVTSVLVTSQPTRSPVSAKPSRPLALACSTFPPTRLT
jgi:hypothetical protein